MTKLEFILSLRDRLSGLSQDEVSERLSFYSEMIEDRMEEGLSEQEAVSQIGSVQEIAAQISAEIPLVKIAKHKLEPKRRLKAWEIILLVLGSPIWLSLIIAALAVVFALYVSMWSVIVSLWAAFGSLVGGAVGAVASAVGLACSGNYLAAAAMIGAALVCAGLSVFLFFGCNAASKGAVLLTKKTILWLKNLLIKKEEA